MLPVDLEDVVEKVNDVIYDPTRYEQHFRAGTLHEYYHEILNTVVAEMAVIPVKRDIEGLGPIDDPDEVSAALKKIADVVANTFGKPIREVETDLIEVMGVFPISDVRTAAILRHQNKLH